ncbi:nitrous oxide reductase family maturation protein NosD [Paenibacillus sp. GCM10027626]|uniref:right-handed parallel beta-helix repeat-containing protein n=1 Tax=Paenibacillus sp. GCM10027626 TaxID=3273411 RepID=UPI00362E4A54
MATFKEAAEGAACDVREESQERRADIRLYVATAGNDRWSGRIDEPLRDGSDGPLASLEGARDRIREWRAAGQPFDTATVFVRGGTYAVTEPIEFSPEDSGHVHIAAYPGETPVFDGGTRITGWQVGELRGRTVWIADMPELRLGTRYFRQLFVDGRRMLRSRIPKQGTYRMESVPGLELTPDNEAVLFAGSDRFRYEAGHIRRWRNLGDVDIVVHHYWAEERMPIASLYEEKRLVVSSRRSVFGLRDDEAMQYAEYYVENVFEGMNEPGEWYADRTEGKLYYLPLPGETPEETEVVAPRIKTFVRLLGAPEEDRYVEGLIFEGLHFRHSDWELPPGGDPELATGMLEMEGLNLAASPQAAYYLPGAIELRGARQCAIERCLLEHIGFYGIDLSHGCVGNRLIGNEIRDIGAGGIKLSGASAVGNAKGPESMRTGRNLLTDNHIHDGGHVFTSGVGILVRHAYGNVISHNHIHHLFYTGISCGWEWGYSDNVTKDNKIEKNCIHDLGFGLINDMGGIYLLGVQPGTVVRGNLIYNVRKKNYGGWGIYLDEGSAHIIVENNIVHHTHSQCFHENIGRENTVRNNIFAFGCEGLATLTHIENHNSITYEKNIFITDGAPVFVGKNEGALQRNAFRSDCNIFWDIKGQQVRHANYDKDERAEMRYLEWFDMEQWRVMGYDLHSVTADPRFADPERGDFAMADDSPALLHGFVPIDLSDVGPRNKHTQK